MIQSVYIHIPFCQQICHYCDFTKFFYNEKQADQYIEALINEINTHVQGKHNQVKTIFIGGGTPTALNLKQLQALLAFINEKFDVPSCEEFTIEANPGDFETEKIKLLKNFGVNRMSLGVQVFDDHMLQEIGRLHQVKDVYQTIDQLHQQGYTNISIDLIYALPNQTLEDFRNTLDEAVQFQLPHYSTYALQIEPKTVFYQRYHKGKLHRPPQETEVQMYELLRETMRTNGVIQYEISNFAKPGYESKHNLTYWNNDYYYGFGAGAHGYLPGKRTGNIRPLPHYVKQAKKDGNPVLNTEQIGLQEQIEEEMFLGLRKLAGVSKTAFANKFGFPMDALYQSEIALLQQKGWLQDNGDVIHLTEQGLLFGNEVFAQFLLEDDELSHLR
ncbi:oxygen-independent coproporphyrinogen III oxidase [Virgibacillus dakarensis]|uniref:Heme chaperone HemW n=1 Tax=Lentibacillus populi TaxID=1827502 RepID=A0A9W5X439_9BACI|nr:MULTISPECIES: radical SAM family heme chaperone HemW [Bacillaceae]MBT2214516.1 oxygen-independent coproporphyrinogen III oxidase [Virgibacillus dakarensis]MTW84121.1 oxygen-independent coproporphyrinogen III oxidase [Virgibacillus dakarensis]GGB28970.1 oxygen-independent coproporphyrinogen-III oxidase-like protein YqeR [Lentibacillus populi]